MQSRTYTPKAGEIERRWYVVDAAGKPLGRVCAAVARVLTGKNKPVYTPFLDTGDFVIVVNADKAVLTGTKDDKKIYWRHSGYPGGIKGEAAGKLRQRRPIKLIENAVWGMLPKTKLGRHQIRKLKVYAGPEHPHQAQQPQPLELQ
jgi:large subunit ribosomal protein L13